MTMPETTDPTFYRSPAEAIAAPPERLAYVAAYDPAGQAKDAIAVLDCDPASADYGRVVGWSELPTAGNELHHFGWNACSSALCHQGHGNVGAPLSDRAGDPVVADLCAGHQARPPPPHGRAGDRG
jgi:selenium-binding protein 1